MVPVEMTAAKARVMIMRLVFWAVSVLEVVDDDDEEDEEEDPGGGRGFVLAATRVAAAAAVLAAARTAGGGWGMVVHPRLVLGCPDRIKTGKERRVQAKCSFWVFSPVLALFDLVLFNETDLSPGCPLTMM
jgi:hypothetical protein